MDYMEAIILQNIRATWYALTFLFRKVSRFLFIIIFITINVIIINNTTVFNILIIKFIN